MPHKAGMKFTSRYLTTLENKPKEREGKDQNRGATVRSLHLQAHARTRLLQNYNGSPSINKPTHIFYKI